MRAKIALSLRNGSGKPDIFPFLCRETKSQTLNSSRMKQLILALALLVSLTTAAQKPYTDLWKEVETLQKKDLPASAAEKCLDIYRLAGQRGDFAVQLRAFVTRAAERQKIHPDSLLADMNSLYTWMAEEKDTVRHAVLCEAALHFLTGYIDAHRSEILRRSNTWEESGSASVENMQDFSEKAAALSPISAALPKWSARDFRDEALRLMALALQHPGPLARVSAESYSGLILRQDGSRYFAHDLLHLIGLSHVDKLQQLRHKGFLGKELYENTWQQILDRLSALYEARGNRSASMLVGLKRLELGHEAYLLPDSAYESGLRTLYSGSRDMDVAVETALALAQFLQEKRRPAEALAVCEEAEKRFLHYDRVKALRQIRADIQRAEVEVHLDGTAAPGDSLSLRLSHRNARSFQLKFYPLRLATPDWRSVSVGGEKFMKQYAGEPIVQTYTLTPPADYLQRDTVIRIPAPQEGTYVVRAVAEKAKEGDSQDLLRVTRLMPFYIEDPAGGTHLYVVDRRNGAPLPGIEVSVYERSGKTPAIATLTTDREGHVFYPQTKRNVEFYAHTPDDTACPMLSLGSYSPRNTRAEVRTGVELFTDRAIYRPGQTVYIKGIVQRTLGDSTWVCPGEEREVKLQDANNQLIASATLRTGEFGSFDHAFQLPERYMSGRFSVQCDGGWAGFQVEEYKRPSFEILLDTLPQAPRLGDTLCLTGRAVTLSGFPLQGDSVRYSVERSTVSPAVWRAPDYPARIALGEETFHGATTTDAEGRFRIEIPAPLPEGISRQDYFAYSYRVNITITDAAGESREKLRTLHVGTKSLVLEFRHNSRYPEDLVPVCKDSLSTVVFKAKDLDGTPRNVELRARLALPGKDAALWEETCRANQKSAATFWKKLRSGRYDLLLEAVDAHGDTTRLRQPILLFGLHDTEMPCDTVFWRQSVPRSLAGEEIGDSPAAFDVVAGSSAQDAHIFYCISTRDRILEKRFVSFSDSLLHFALEYRPEYGDGASLALCMIRDGKQYRYQRAVTKPRPDKQLKLKWTSFRDHLQAGQSEEWTLSVARPDGTPADAELMASLYDAALDQIEEHHISVSHYYPRLSSYINFRWNYDNSVSLYSYEYTKPYRYPAFGYDQWDFPYFAFTPRMMRKVYNATASAAMDIADVKQVVVQTEEEAAAGEVPYYPSELLAGRIAGLDPANSPDEPREDFRESAFFYPTLRTDSAGAVRIAFTLPESLTRWRLVGLAHTRDFCTGELDESITASKPFMLSSHLPRYLRQGDEAEVSARLLNASGTEVSGTVRLELFDPATMEVLHSEKRKFRLAADSSAACSFAVSAKEEWQTVGIRLMADADDFSDGEQHELAVLSARTHLVQAVPLTLRGEGEEEYDLSELFNAGSPTATQKRYTVELYANPAWSAVMALPVLAVPQRESALELAAAYYANTISAWLVGESQELQQILLQQNGKSASTFSKIMQHSELKALQLEETPWVAEAREESNAQAAIAQLADQNSTAFRRAEMLRRLQALQQGDGSLAWYPEMRGNSYVTARVAEMFCRLHLLTGAAPEGEMKTLLEKACSYLYTEEGKRFDRLTAEARKDYRLSASDLDYLYLCTLAPARPEGSAAEAEAFYLRLLPAAIPSFDLGRKARAVTVLTKNNQAAAARDYYRSIQEYATQTPELGSFFAGQSSFGYQPVELLATIIEASRLMGDTALTAEMQLNLLRHKQTQAWSNALASANAVYALLHEATNLSGRGATCSLTLGSHTLSTAARPGSAEALMGYAKASFPADGSTTARALFRKTGQGVAWGAVYGECDEQTDRVSQQGTRVKVEKELFVLRTGGSEEVWEKIGPQTRLHKGDRILTRLFVENDRDLDFVYLKDSRAACLEPLSQLSGYRGGAYQVEKDASTTLFFDRLTRGTHTYEIRSIVAHDGTYSSGVARLQCAYSAEFTGHSSSTVLHVD